MLKIRPQYSSVHILCAKSCNHYFKVIKTQDKKKKKNLTENFLCSLKSKKNRIQLIVFILYDKHSFMTMFFLLINFISFIHEIRKNFVIFLYLFPISSVGKMSEQMYINMPPTSKTNIYKASGK